MILPSTLSPFGYVIVLVIGCANFLAGPTTVPLEYVIDAAAKSNQLMLFLSCSKFFVPAVPTTVSPEGIFVLTPFIVTVAPPAVPFPFCTTSIIEGSVMLGLAFMISRLIAATSSSVNSLIFLTGVLVVGATIAALVVVPSANTASTFPTCPARFISA